MGDGKMMYEKRIAFIMKDYNCDRDVAGRILDDISHRNDPFAEMAKAYIRKGVTNV